MLEVIIAIAALFSLGLIAISLIIGSQTGACSVHPARARSASQLFWAGILGALGLPAVLLLEAWTGDLALSVRALLTLSAFAYLAAFRALAKVRISHMRALRDLTLKRRIEEDLERLTSLQNDRS